MVFRILALRQKVSPTDTYILRKHSRLVREAFGGLEADEPEGGPIEQWVAR